MLSCPVCHAPLASEERAFRCPAGHSFDRAREGYVYLVGSKHPGDTKPMLQARRAFLDAGHYRPLVDAISAAVLAQLAAHPAASPVTVLDVGCGEGYYIARLSAVLADAGHSCRGLGLDVSKDAVRMAARRYPDIQFVVADITARLPLLSGSVDVLLDIFAPRNPAEFARVLAPSGLLLIAIPGPAHLAELRARLPLLGIEPEKREHVLSRFATHFALAESRSLEYSLSLVPTDLRALVAMTPSAYHLSRATLDALPAVSQTVTASIELLCLTPSVPA